jgi:hypothetical protein
MSKLLSEANRAMATGLRKGMTCRPWWLSGKQTTPPDREYVQNNPGAYDAGHVIGSLLQLGVAFAMAATGTTLTF